MMKRLTAIILTLMLALTLCVPAMAADYATAVVKGGWLRLRDSASPDALTISAYYTGTEVTILGGSGSWFYVRTPDGKTGYMHADYLDINSSITGGEVYDDADGYVVSSNGKGVNLRTGPGVSYHIVGTFEVGTPLTILSSGGTWSQVNINGATGWMMNDFIKMGYNGNVDVVESYTAYVVSGNGKGVVMRSGPSKQYDILATYNVGQPVTVLSYGKTWCEISVNGLEGYMMTEYLSTKKPAVSGGVSASYTAYVTSGNGKGVRMRMGAGTLYPTIATYCVGTKVTVLDYGKSWCKIRVGSNTGYMMTEFLTTSQPDMVTGVSINLTTVRPGDTLRATVSPADADVAIIWINNSGETLGYGANYLVDEMDEGTKIRATVSGTGYTSGTVVSAWATVQESYVSRVYQLKSISISDTTPMVGDTLRATLAPSGATASISWFRDNGVFVGSGSSYTVRAVDKGYRLYAFAEGTGDTSGEVTSAYTAAVTAAVSQTVVLQGVSISDTTPTVGDTLKALTVPGNATAAFTWRSSAGHVLGYGDTYTVAESDKGHSIYVYANGTGDTTGSKVSSLTAAVQAKAVDLRVENVTLSDTTPTVGQVLYVTVDPAAASVDYTWLRDDDKILSTTNYYTVKPDDVGHSLYVWAEGTNGTFGSATTKISAPVTE